MADVQTENGFTKLANELMEAFAKVSFTSYQTRILFALLRKTYGWKKIEDEISLSQFSEMTGIDRRNISKPLKELQGMAIIKIKKISHMKIAYSLQKDFEQWRTDMQPHVTCKRSTDMKPARTDMQPHVKTDMQPHVYKRKKENNKRNIAQKLSDKETLSCFLSEKCLSFSVSINELTLDFINRVRMANKHKTITSTRAAKIADALGAIAEKYSADNMAAGIRAVSKKTDFNFSGHDPAAYVRAVAKGEHVKGNQQQTEQAHHAEREALRAAPASGLFAEIQQTINER